MREKVEKSRNPEDTKRGHLQRFVFVFSDGADNVDPKFFFVKEIQQLSLEEGEETQCFKHVFKTWDASFHRQRVISDVVVDSRFQLLLLPPCRCSCSMVLP